MSKKSQRSNEYQLDQTKIIFKMAWKKSIES